MSLSRLCAPRSVAVVGATDRPGSYARVTLENLAVFGGSVVGVHPTRTEVLGVRCVPTLADAGPVDAVVIATPAATVPDLVRQSRELGCGGAVVYAAEFAEAGGVELTQALREAAGDFPVIGPNGNGLVSVPSRAALWGDSVTLPNGAGSIAVVTQSGNVGVIALAHRGGLGLHTVVSIGNAAVTGTADVMTHLATTDGVRVIAMYLESDGVGRDLANALAVCAEHDVRVTVLKAGRSVRGAEASAAHTASLAGDQRVFAALMREAGGVMVRDPHSLLETARAMAVVRRDRRGAAVLSSSGADAAVAADLAHDVGATLAELSADTVAAVAQHLPAGALITNPLDHTNRVWADTAAVADIAFAVGSDPAVGHLMYLQDQPPAQPPLMAAEWAATRVGGIHGGQRAGLTTLVVNTTPGQEPEGAISGVAPALMAIAAMQQEEPSAERLRAIATAATVPGRWHPPMAEHEAKDLLRARGTAVPAGRVVSTADEAVLAATELGGRVALKVSAPGLLHKAQAGALALDLRDSESVHAAANRLLALPEAETGALLVEAMVEPGIEMMVAATAAGVVPALVIGLGGARAEAIDDVVVLPLPATVDQITQAIRALRCWPYLGGGDTDALGQIACAAGELLQDEGLSLIEINPVIMAPTGAVAVDAVILS